MIVLRVAIPSPLRRHFDYLPPLDAAPDSFHPGCRVKVPFGKRELIGLLLEVTSETDVPLSKLKPVIEILDTTPLQPQYIRDLALWAADYYQHPIGDALLQSLPVYLRKGGECVASHTYLWKTLPDTTLLDISGRAHQQQALYQLIDDHPQGISQEAIKAEGGQTSLLATLETKQLIQRIQQKHILPDASHLLKEAPLPLNPEQQVALNQIIQGQDYRTFLLDGITGSGKTEVYLQAIHHVLKMGLQALILVPEIGLTPQTVQRFRHRFRVPVAVLHSSLTDKQRFDAWMQASQGEAPIVIGTRSAIFTPLKSPGIIIIDEEHDSSFKQQDGFRYSARDLSIVRAHAEQIPIILGSATPSLESLHNCALNRYQHLTLRKRAGNASAPDFQLLDIKKLPLNNGISAPLINQIKQHLKQGTQVLVFINRRGFAPSLICHDCGWLAECRRCDARMTLHQKPAHLHCHHCDSQRPIPRHCDQCGSQSLKPVGAGTERTEQTLNELFPKTPILRVDRDSTSRKGAMAKIMDQVHQGDPCILVGTQMLAKGHHFPKVTLVAILDADAGLFSTDFRGMERTAQMIIQVAGRAGRADHPGTVVLQTHHAEHPLLSLLATKGYEVFAKEELKRRHSFQLPPYQHIAILRAEAAYTGRAEGFLQSIRDHQYTVFPQIQWSGPFPSPMEKRAGFFRSQLLLSSHSRPLLQNALSSLCLSIEQHPMANKIRWTIDVDPYDLY
ncbi:primosomal protein N' [Neptunomonas antarctica]|uniref:Replication restart protein PriA n=1 Tax=Neptunomonas antarctica TaxID=619304 RepID=A0A1N7J2S8_9GAMM|nr:primosomal protein N' [Neptunomonas antarctica]SIS43672.1 replication restart DNA helicase PriA [Neptunomonas antarctica]